MRKIALAVLGIAVSLCLAGNALAAGATKDECVSKTKESAAMVNEKGLDAAIAEINKKDGKFVWADSYVFLMDFDGKMLAHPMSPALVGTTCSTGRTRRTSPSSRSSWSWPSPREKDGPVTCGQSRRPGAEEKDQLHLSRAGKKPPGGRGNLGIGLGGHPRSIGRAGVYPPALYPPASLTVKPRRESSDTIVSRGRPGSRSPRPLPFRRFRSGASGPTQGSGARPPERDARHRGHRLSSPALRFPADADDPVPAGGGSAFPQRHFALAGGIPGRRAPLRRVNQYRILPPPRHLFPPAIDLRRPDRI